jgi:hypothetical protein
MVSRLCRLKIYFRRCGEKKSLFLLLEIEPRFLSRLIQSLLAVPTQISYHLIAYEIFLLFSNKEQWISNNFRVIALNTVIVNPVFINLRQIITKKIITLRSPSCFSAVDFCICSRVQEKPLVPVLIRLLSSFQYH